MSAHFFFHISNIPCFLHVLILILGAYECSSKNIDYMRRSPSGHFSLDDSPTGKEKQKTKRLSPLGALQSEVFFQAPQNENEEPELEEILSVPCYSSNIGTTANPVSSKRDVASKWKCHELCSADSSCGFVTYTPGTKECRFYPQSAADTRRKENGVESSRKDCSLEDSLLNEGLWESARESSLYSPSPLKSQPENCLKKKISTNFLDGTCTHTNEDPDPWWLVKLVKTMEIVSVTLTNRDNCCPGRLADFKILIGSGSCEGASVCKAVDEDVGLNKTKKFVCNSPLVGDTICVRKNTAGYLTLCHVAASGYVERTHDISFGQFSPWSSCSTSCGNGTQWRKRDCEPANRPIIAGKPVDKCTRDKMVETRACENNPDCATPLEKVINVEC